LTGRINVTFTREGLRRYARADSLYTYRALSLQVIGPD